MRKRNIKIQLWLNLREADLLDRKAKNCGISRTAYLRHLVNGFQPRELPPPDYRDLMNALYGIGRNLNQDEEVRKLENAIRTITDAMVSPMPMDR